ATRGASAPGARRGGCVAGGGRGRRAPSGGRIRGGGGADQAVLQGVAVGSGGAVRPETLASWPPTRFHRDSPDLWTPSIREGAADGGCRSMICAVLLSRAHEGRVKISAFGYVVRFATSTCTVTEAFVRRTMTLSP